jgi:hypothetical protein
VVNHPSDQAPVHKLLRIASKNKIKLDFELHVMLLELEQTEVPESARILGCGFPTTA